MGEEDGSPLLPCFEWSFDRCFLVQNSMPGKWKCSPAHSRCNSTILGGRDEKCGSSPADDIKYVVNLS